LFDKVVLLCKGKCIYQGPPKRVLSYFASHDYRCEEHDNPADFALDVLIKASKTKASFQKLTKAYIHSPINARMADIIADLDPDDNEIYDIDDERPDEENHSFRTEIFYVAQRTLKNAVRNPQLALSQTVVAVVLGFLVGLVFYDMEGTVDKGVQNRLGAIFFIVVSQIFSTVTALEPLLKERVLFIHVSLCLSFFHLLYLN
jgi:ATP-binding cassette subfamily G (WHITE) protein 2